jgi:hypothetical protein
MHDNTVASSREAGLNQLFQSGVLGCSTSSRSFSRSFLSFPTSVWVYLVLGLASDALATVYMLWNILKVRRVLCPLCIPVWLGPILCASQSGWGLSSVHPSLAGAYPLCIPVWLGPIHTESHCTLCRSPSPVLLSHRCALTPIYTHQHRASCGVDF